MQKFHITSPIYYVNSEPHIGHLYTNVICDFLARFYKIRGCDVIFTTGTDEHGQKIYQAAETRGVSVEKFCHEMSEKFRSLFSQANIMHDKFIRTTMPEHKNVVQHLWSQLQKKGEIYFGRYSGWYSVSEESYYASREVVVDDNGVHRSPSGQPVEQLDVDSYFFKLSKWQQPLLDFYSSRPDFISPKERYNEVISFVQEGLQDLSVSRPNVNWGISVPNDEKHTVYVWIDALINYLTAYGFPTKPSWPPTMQVLGKDILRFHAVYWPAMLMAAGIEIPQSLCVHGWWIVKGDKMSKSLGNVVRPQDLLERYGVDATRYAMLASFALGHDGEYNEDAILSLINRDLADVLGNLLQRVLVLLNRHFGSKVPRPVAFSEADKKLLRELDQYAEQYEKHIADLKILSGLKGCMRLAILGNRYLQDMQPWSLISKDMNRAHTVMHVISRLLVVLAGYLWPALPETMEQLLGAFGIEAKNIKLAELINMDLTGRKTSTIKPLFPKIH